MILAPEGADVPALKFRCEAACGRNAVPRAVLRIDKAPRNESGKIMREVVRKQIRVDLPKATA